MDVTRRSRICRLRNYLAGIRQNASGPSGRRRRRTARSLEQLEPRRVLDSTVVFNEIMYNPADADEQLEWLELHNQMAVDVDLSGWSLDGGVDFPFPVGTVIPGGGYLVVAADPAVAAGAGIGDALGPYTGRLSNGGEQIELRNNSDRLMDSVDYSDDTPWPVAPDGSGASLAKRDPDSAGGPAENWVASAQLGGTPGRENFSVQTFSTHSETLVSPGSDWSYFDSGAAPADWNAPGFDDAAWQTGPATLGFGSSTASVAPYTPDANTLHLWHLDETAGAYADTGNGVVKDLADVAGQRDAAELEGFGNAFVSAIGGTDATPKGASTNYVDSQSDYQGADGSFTLEALIAVDDLGAADFQQIVSREGDASTEGRSFQFRIRAAGQQGAVNDELHFEALNGDGTLAAEIPTVGTHAFAPGEWFHVAVTYNGTAGQTDNLKFYWTRMDVGASEANLIGAKTLAADLPNTKGGETAIAVHRRGGFRDPLLGRIDEVRISDIARAPGDFLFGGGSSNTALDAGQSRYYFRRRFEFAADAGATTQLKLRSLIDDGAVFYLNGREVLRQNMPEGDVDASTLAASEVTAQAWTAFLDLPSDDLADGTNVLAVEVHQAAAVDTDLVFDAHLDAVIVTPDRPDEIVSTVIHLGDDWKFDDTDTDPATADWTAPGFVDDAWASGPAAFATNTVVGPVLPSPAAYWNFDDNVLDQSGNGNNGTLVGATYSADVPPLLGSGKSLDFQASGYVDVGIAWPAGDYSVSAWVKPDVLSGIQYVVGVQQSGNVGGRMLRLSGGDIQMEHINTGGIQDAQSGPLAVGTWHHLAATFDDASNDLKLYVDGALRTTVPIAGDSSLTLANLAIGTRPDKTADNRFSGNLDEIILWPEAISPADVAALAAGPVSFSPAAGTTQLDNPADAYYFRNDFQMSAEPGTSAEIDLRTRLADGAVFYLNGQEVYRQNMPGGPIGHSTFALGQIDAPSTSGTISIPADALADGLNVLAVEVHKSSAVDDDALFDAELTLRLTPPSAPPPVTLAINEVSATDVPFQVELFNFGQEPIDLDGYFLARSGTVDGQYVLPAVPLAAGGFVTLDATTLGFAAESGDRLFLFQPAKTGVVDAVVVKKRHRGRSPDGLGPWLQPDAPTFGSANSFSFHDEIVINEIMYHHAPQYASAGTPATYATATLLDYAGSWRYNQSGVDLGTAWYQTAHAAGGDWSQGAGLLAFEDEPLPEPIGTTLVDPVLNTPFVTTYYFETEFDLSAAQLAGLEQLQLWHIVDDGAVFYVNGTEVDRYKMDGAVGDPVQAATSANGGGDAALAGPITITSGQLIEGTNRLSVEVHQTSDTSSDVVFGAKLLAMEQLTPEMPGDPFEEVEEEWIELYNQSGHLVELTDWVLDEAVDFAFPPGTTIAPGEYLVVANDHVALQADYPDATVIGDFDRQLNNRSDRIVLLDAEGNPADEVHYYDGGRWPEAADGGGSSLELKHPRADNTSAESWAASEEGSGSQWHTYTYRGIANPAPGSSDPTEFNEFVLGLLDAGQLLLDDISVVEDPDGAARELIQNGTFDSGTADKWRTIGNHGSHGRTQVIVDPADAGNQVLHLVATGPTEHIHNHAETTLKFGDQFVAVQNGQAYEISFRAKWISGSPQLNTRLYFNRLARTTIIDVPPTSGTPGRENSSFQEDVGPTYTQFGHSPAVPTPGQNVTVTARADDPDGVTGMTLWFSAGGGTWQSAAMTPDAQGLFQATIPGLPASTIVQFYVEAEDGQHVTSTYPADGRGSRALLKVDDGLASEGGAHNFRIIMTGDDSGLLHELTNVMSNDLMGATVVYNETDVFYDVGVRLKSSHRGRYNDTRLGFTVRFDPDAAFRGIHETVQVDRSGIGRGSPYNYFGQGEIVSFHMINRAGGVPGYYNDLIHVIAPRAANTSSALLVLTAYRDEMLDTQYENGSDGTLFKFSTIYYPQASSTVGGDPEGLKIPARADDGIMAMTIRNLGDNEEAYRWNYLIENNRAQDEYGPMVELAQTFSLSGSAFQNAIGDVIDVDQFLRTAAMMSLIGTSDNYYTSGGNNLMLYVRPEDGRVLFFPWDHDWQGASATAALAGNDDIRDVIASPQNARLFYGHLQDIIATTFNTEYMTDWTAHYNSLVSSNQNYGQILSYIGQRASHVAGQLNSLAPNVPFAITTGGGNPIEVDRLGATIEGDGWIDVREIRLAGSDEPIDVTWIDADSWRLTVPVDPGLNEITLEAYDFQGVPAGTDSITVTSTAIAGGVREDLRIGEIMYHPADPAATGPESAFADDDDFEFVELVNTGSAELDLSGVALTDGIAFTFGPGTMLPVGERILVVRDLAAFSARYGAGGMNIAGEYRDPLFGGNKLSNDGETIRLEDGVGAVIQEFAYNDGSAWPQAADGTGMSLEIVGTDGDYDDPASWHDSSLVGGSPGRAADALVLGRYLFYDGSSFDAGGNAGDDAAVADDKTALVPGQTATFDNVTSFDGGINGLMIDVAHAPAAASIDAADLAFAIGNNDAPGTWQTIAAASIDVRAGAGRGGSDRIVVTWTDGLVTNEWLEVRVLAAGPHTGLATDDLFYFGNAIGETGNSLGAGLPNALGAGLPTPPLVNAADVIAIRDNPRGPGNPASIDNPHDVNRDRSVNAVDMILARDNATGPLSALRWTAAPTPAPPPPPTGEGESPFAGELSSGTGSRSVESLDSIMAAQVDHRAVDSPLPAPMLGKLLRQSWAIEDQ